MTYAEFVALVSQYDADLVALPGDLERLIDRANNSDLAEGALQDLADACGSFRNRCRTAHDDFVAAVAVLTN